MNSELTSLRTHVRQYIVDGIADGNFCPGDKISEQEIANALGVSRTPAREALLQLNSEGLLDYLPRRGFSIKRMNEKEKQDNYELVAALDSFCARNTAPFLDDADFRLMHEIVDKIDIAIKYHNVNDYRILQLQFHDVYRQKNGNETILHMLDIAESGVVPQIYVGEDQEEMTEIYKLLNDEHRKILSLLEARDAIGVETFLLETHWSARFPQLTQVRTGSKSAHTQISG